MINPSNKISASNHKNWTLFENHNDSIFVLNLQGDIIFANEAVSKLLGYSKEEFLNIDLKEIIASESTDIFNYYFQKAAESEMQEFITKINCKCGKILEIKIITISNELDGKIDTITGFLSETTGQTNPNLLLSRTSKELCESFIENNRDPILLLDLDAVIVLANHAFSRLLGWQKENLEGYHILLCPSIPPYLVDQMRDYYGRVVRCEPNLSTLETIRITTEGKAHYMMLSITPIYDQNAQLCNWAVHLRDITAQKEAEQSLMRAEKLLGFGQFAAGVAQEIKAPLASLDKFIQSIKSSKDSVLYNDNYLDQMSKELNRIENVVNEFTILAKTQPKPHKIIDIAGLIRNVIALAKTQAIIKNVHIEFEFDQISQTGVWGEGQQLKQALFNVIQNGIEATPNGGILQVNLELSGDSLRIHVIDHGKGILEEDILKLGAPFHSTKEKKMGLGLTLTYKIIEQHDGKISVQSHAEKGTRFMIELPLVV